MTKADVTNMFHNLGRTIEKHSPEILTGIGIAGMVTTTVLAVKATPKAIKLLEKERKRRNEELTAVDVVKTTWKCYIPAVVTGATSVACLIGASSVNMKRNAALATAYSISHTALTEYQEKVIETIGEKKERAVRDKIAEDRVKNNPVSNNSVIMTERGNTLCYDAMSGRYFRSDIDKIKKAENFLNNRLINEMYFSLNEFYEELGLEPTRLGDELGWNMSDGLIEIFFRSQIADDGNPCIVVDYNIAPKYDYSRFT